MLFFGLTLAYYSSSPVPPLWFGYDTKGESILDAPCAVFTARGVEGVGSLSSLRAVPAVSPTTIKLNARLAWYVTLTTTPLRPFVRSCGDAVLWPTSRGLAAAKSLNDILLKRDIRSRPAINSRNGSVNLL